MDKLSVDLPGYKGVDANFLAAILDEVHDIAQEIAYFKNINLSGLDRKSKSYFNSACSLAMQRAHDELSEIMLDIRNMRTSIAPADRPSYRVLASKYISTSDTKE